MTHFLPTRKTVEAAWDRYAALKRAVANDPLLETDKDMGRVLERAHGRMLAAYERWCRG